jgi:ACR3 family arsenite transporter
LIAGILTRFSLLFVIGKYRFEKKFIPFFGPLSLLALLYTIIIIFAEQARNILHNLGPVFRTFVPLILYFALMCTSTFFLVWWALYSIWQGYLGLSNGRRSIIYRLLQSF